MGVNGEMEVSMKEKCEACGGEAKEGRGGLCVYCENLLEEEQHKVEQEDDGNID